MPWTYLGFDIGILSPELSLDSAARLACQARIVCGARFSEAHAEGTYPAEGCTEGVAHRLHPRRSRGMRFAGDPPVECIAWHTRQCEHAASWADVPVPQVRPLLHLGGQPP